MNYEVMYIVDTTLEETARKELVEKFSGLVESNGGTIQKVEEMGKRHLAYAINYKTEGWYYLMTFSSESELPKELARNMSIADGIIRYLVVKLEEKQSKVKPKPVRPAPIPVPVQPAPEAVVEAPAEPAAEAPAAEAQDATDAE